MSIMTSLRGDIFLRWSHKFSRSLYSCVLPFYIFFIRLVINERWCIHFGFYIIFCIFYLKVIGVWYTIVRLFVNNTDIQGGSSCIFYYFVLSPSVFLINFVALPPFSANGLKNKINE